MPRIPDHPTTTAPFAVGGAIQGSVPEYAIFQTHQGMIGHHPADPDDNHCSQDSNCSSGIVQAFGARKRLEYRSDLKSDQREGENIEHDRCRFPDRKGRYPEMSQHRRAATRGGQPEHDNRDHAR